MRSIRLLRLLAVISFSLIAGALLIEAASAAGCDMIAPPSEPLTVAPFYADPQGSVIDARRRAERDRAVAPYEAFVRVVQAQADAFTSRGDVTARDCAIKNLTSWARSNVLVGRLRTAQANYERNWYLTGFSLAYLKIRSAIHSTDAVAIEDWLRHMATDATAAIDAGAIPPNNLLYWAGLALETVGIATGDAALQSRARRILLDALMAVAPDGTLAREMSRGAKALDYHAFAAAPLVLMALIETQCGRPADLPALMRLADRVIGGLRDPVFFDRQARAPQEQPARWSLAWLGIYQALVPGAVVPTYDTVSHFLGGDIRQTIAAVRNNIGHSCR